MSLEFTLRIWHPNLDPEAVTKALGISPSVAYKAGSPRTLPSGVAASSYHRESLWAYDVPLSPNSSLAEAIEAVTALLSPQLQGLHQLQDQGARVEYFVGLFVDAARVEVLEARQIEKLAELRFEVVLNIYPPDLRSGASVEKVQD